MEKSESETFEGMKENETNNIETNKIDFETLSLHKMDLRSNSILLVDHSSFFVAAKSERKVYCETLWHLCRIEWISKVRLFFFSTVVHSSKSLVYSNKIGTVQIDTTKKRFFFFFIFSFIYGIYVCRIRMVIEQTIESICMLPLTGSSAICLSINEWKHFLFDDQTKKTEKNRREKMVCVPFIGRGSLSFSYLTMGILELHRLISLILLHLRDQENWPRYSMFGWFFNWTLKPIQQCETVVKNSSEFAL